MSTYYKFVCKECKESGGFLSRQAWGTGNFDVIETFKFLGVHMSHRPTLYSENDQEYEDTPDISTKELGLKFVEKSRGIMPHSNDYEIIEKNDWKDVEPIWEKNFIERNY